MTMENEQTPGTVIPNGKLEAPTVPAEAPPVEGAPKAEAAEAKPDDKFSQKFALLSKKEREIQLREKQVNEKLSKYGTIEEIQKLLEEDPTGAFEKLGTTYEKIVDRLISNPKKALTELDLLRKEVEETKKIVAEEKAAKDQVLRQKEDEDYKRAQKEFIMGNKDKFELTIALNEWDTLLESAKVFKETHGREPTHEEIAGLAENHFDSVVEPLFTAILQTKKYGDRAKEWLASQATKEESLTANQTLPGKSQTLTNKMSQTVTNPEADKYLTAEERLKKALSMLR